MGKIIKLEKYLNNLDSIKIDYFYRFLNIEKQINMQTNKKRELFRDVLENNHLETFEEYLEIFHLYRNSKKLYEKVEYRYGKERANFTRKKLQIRSQIHNQKPRGVLTKSYWIERGYTEEEAILKVKDEARRIGLEGYKNRKYPKKGEHAKKLKYSKSYWIERGYTEEEAKELQKPYLLPMLASLEGFEYRHENKEEAKELYDKRLKKRLKTMVDRYGSTIVSCKTSKESLKFFYKLYKKLRKSGFEKNDIMWGISGSREFATRYDDRNYMYDFCILSKKIIIEYNNTFWHFHEDYDFNNPFLDKTDVIQKDLLKKYIVEKMGFKIYYVWNFEDHSQRIEDLYKEITYEE